MCSARIDPSDALRTWLERTKFELRQNWKSDDPEWSLFGSDGMPTGVVLRDWTASGLLWAVLRDGELIEEGLQLTQAGNLAASLLE